MNTKTEKTRLSLLTHYRRYPKLQLRDILKYLHQSAFGCEHLVSSEDDAVKRIRAEYAKAERTNERTLDRLDGEYSRVHLSCLNDGISPETLGRLFYLSSQREETGEAELLCKLQAVRELIHEAELPFSEAEFERILDEWRKDGYTALRHSETFRSEYRPAYRVISNKYAELLPVFSLIDKSLRDGSAVIAIEGGSASGKTTLANMIAQIYGCTVFHMDDFFLRPEQRTAERLSETGGNVDRERFSEEVLKSLSKGGEVTYRRFDCGAQALCPPMTVKPSKLTVVEGAYSMHPELAPYYTASIFLDIDSEYQRERILKRNTPYHAERFFREWIPLELKYFSEMRIKEKCTINLSVTRPIA